MAFLHSAKPIRCQNPYRQRLGFDLLLRRGRKLQDRSPFACCSRGYESRCGLRIANPPRSKVTKRCQPEINVIARATTVAHPSMIALGLVFSKKTLGKFWRKTCS